MEISFKKEQVDEISFKVGIPKVMVNEIISGYVGYLRGRIQAGKTVKFLNICYLRVAGKDEELHETLAYISTELSKELGRSQVMVNRVLLELEEMIIRDVSRLGAVTVRGLVRIKAENTYSGYRVRIKKSTSYNGEDVYVTTLPSFKRRVYRRMEGVGA